MAKKSEEIPIINLLGILVAAIAVLLVVVAVGSLVAEPAGRFTSGVDTIGGGSLGSSESGGIVSSIYGGGEPQPPKPACPPDAECKTDSDCAAGSYCPQNICICTPKKEGGSGTGDTGDECKSDADCKSNLRCRGMPGYCG